MPTPAPFIRHELELTMNGETHPAAVLFFAPEQAGLDWICRFAFEGFDPGPPARARGVDASQALQLAMKMAAAILYTSGLWRSGALSRYGARDLGLPVAGEPS